LQFVNDLHGLISPVPKGTPLPLVLLGKVGALEIKAQSSFRFYIFVLYQSLLLFSVEERTFIYILVPGSNCLAWEIRNI